MVADTGELVFPASATFARNGDMLIADSSPQVFATYLLSNNTLTRVIGPGDVMSGNGDVIAVLLGATLNSSRQVVITAETFGGLASHVPVVGGNCYQDNRHLYLHGGWSAALLFRKSFHQ